MRPVPTLHSFLSWLQEAFVDPFNYSGVLKYFMNGYPAGKELYIRMRDSVQVHAAAVEVKAKDKAGHQSICR
jgi:hypothetical protein